MNKLKIKLKADDVKSPVYATEGSACFDIHAYSYEGEREFSEDIAANETAVFGTGLYVEIPKGKALLIFSRSGQGFTYDVSLSNGTGIIDSDYRGEIMVKLRMDKDAIKYQKYFTVENGDRIAQCMLVDAPQVEFEFVHELSDTLRGEGAFGHTGVK